jgi:hypothetical protein
MNLVAHSHYERVPNYRDLTQKNGIYLKEVKSSNRYLYSEHEAFRRLQKHIYKIWKDADDKGERYLPHEFMYKMLYQAFRRILRNRFEKIAGCMLQQKKLTNLSRMGR